MYEPSNIPRPTSVGGGLYPEECDLIAALQRLVDQGLYQTMAARADDEAMGDPRGQLARVFAAFGG